jgi:hypothetical protein
MVRIFERRAIDVDLFTGNHHGIRDDLQKLPHDSHMTYEEIERALRDEMSIPSHVVVSIPHKIVVKELRRELHMRVRVYARNCVRPDNAMPISVARQRIRILVRAIAIIERDAQIHASQNDLFDERAQ